MNLVIFALIGFFAVFLEIPQLFKAKLYRDLFLFISLILLSFSLIILDAIGLSIPSPSKVIEAVIKIFINVKFGFQ